MKAIFHRKIDVSLCKSWSNEWSWFVELDDEFYGARIYSKEYKTEQSARLSWLLFAKINRISKENWRWV